MEPEIDQIKRSLSVLFEPGDTVEMRCVGDRTINGFYRDHDKLEEDACQLNGKGFNSPQNVYVCLIPVHPELYARRADQFGYARKGAGVRDQDIVCRRWLLVDVDPVRPAGVSATDEQKRAAIDLAKQVFAWLQDQLGGGCIVCADSGNGAHMLIRLGDLTADDESHWVCERLLQRLAERFSDNQAKVDTTTHNAARICTLYGTVKRKGSDIPEQSHRLSKIVHVPDPLLPVEWSRLSALVAPFPGNQPAEVCYPPTTGDVEGWDIDQLLDQRGLEYTRTDDYPTRSGELATRYELEVCPFDPAHNDRSAFLLQWQNGAVCFGCHHDGCHGRGWQELKQAWGLPDGNGVTAADIILPQPTVSSMPYGTTASSMSLESYINPPKAPASAFYGPLGEIAADLKQYTEASPIAVLAGVLMYYGNAVGRRFYARLDEPHFPKLYIALVGPTGSGRKGTADSQSQRIMDAVDATSELLRHSGLSTGEGLLQVLDQNRDGMFPRPAVFTEREFAAVFRRAERKGNTLNSFIRDAWDDRPLANNSVSTPLRIVDHHVSICAHVTPGELKRLLTSQDVANGFSNRFLWIFTRRNERKPNAVGFQAARYTKQITQLRQALEAAQQAYNQAGAPVELPFSQQAAALWQDELYPLLDVDNDDDTQLILMTNR